MEEDEKIEGTMFSEISLFVIIKNLDQLISLSTASQEGYSIVQRFSNPENLKHLMELAVETSP